MSNTHALFQQQFLNSTRERIYFRDCDGKLTWANQAFLEDAGKASVDDIVGTTLADIVLEPAIADILAEIEKHTSHRRKFQSRTQMRCRVASKDATVSLECHPIFAEAGNDNTFEGTVSRYSIEEICNDLGYDKTLIDSLMKSTHDCIYFKDRMSRFIRVSDSMIERLGAEDMESIIGKSDFDFWNHDCAQGFFDTEQEIIATGEPMMGQCDQELRHDGKMMWVISSKMPLVDEFGNVVGTFGISKDITELKQTELKLENTHKQLIQASRQAGMAEIATNVLHNVGNVLNSISVSISVGRELAKGQNLTNLRKVAQLLEENADNVGYLRNDPKGKALPGFIELSAQTLENTQQRLIDEFDNLHKHLNHVMTVVTMQQEYAGTKHVLEKMAISSLVEDAIQIGEGTLLQSGVGVKKQYLADVFADVEKHKVLQILINLIRNAKHACEDACSDREKVITISIDTPATDFFSIEIADNGVGIDPDNLTNIFTHGFTTKEMGKGFGLHSSANTAKQMGGSLIATSSGIGKGASFVLTLPVNPKQRTPQDTNHWIGESPSQIQLREKIETVATV